MTLNEYQKLAMRTCNITDDTDKMRTHALHELCSEVGELHGIYQKAYQGHPIDIEHCKKELGDILWGVAEYATAMGFELEDVAQLNLDKLLARFPNGFEVEKSLHRADGDI